MKKKFVWNRVLAFAGAFVLAATTVGLDYITVSADETVEQQSADTQESTESSEAKTEPADEQSESAQEETSESSGEGSQESGGNTDNSGAQKEENGTDKEKTAEADEAHSGSSSSEKTDAGKSGSGTAPSSESTKKDGQDSTASDASNGADAASSAFGSGESGAEDSAKTGDSASKEGASDASSSDSTSTAATEAVTEGVTEASTEGVAEAVTEAATEALTEDEEEEGWLDEPLTYEGKDYKVEVTPDEDAHIAKGASLAVNEITDDHDDYDAYVDDAREAVEKDWKDNHADQADSAVFTDGDSASDSDDKESVSSSENDSKDADNSTESSDSASKNDTDSTSKEKVSIAPLRLFDIHIENKDGDEIQPDDKVDVKITFDDAVDLPDDTEVKTVHFKDDSDQEDADDAEKTDSADTDSDSDQKGPDGTTPEIIDTDTKSDGDNDSTAKEVSFTTDSFSVFAVMTAQTEKIEAAAAKTSSANVVHDFKAEVFYGGTKDTNGRYVWNARNHAEGHRFHYRVSFGLGDADSGSDKNFEPQTVKITIPKTILKDRKGNKADKYEMSIPSWDDVKEAEESGEKLDNDISFAYEEKDDKIVISNFRPIEPGFDGFIEAAYITTEETFDYKDMQPQGEEYKAEIEAIDPENPDSDWVMPENSPYSVAPVYINTQATLETMTERIPVQYDSWQSSWGTAPTTVKDETGADVNFNAKDFTYFVYEIESRVGDNSQAYKVEIDDKISSMTRIDQDGKSETVKPSLTTGLPIAYKFNGTGNFTTSNVSGEVKENGYRYDYVLVAFDREFMANSKHLDITNDTTVKIEPVDGKDLNPGAENKADLDDSSSQTFRKRFVWNKPTFNGGGGGFGDWVRADGFYRYQEGRNEWPRVYFSELGMQAGDYSRYDLDDLKSKRVNHLDGLDYAIWVEGYTTRWTLDRDAVVTPSGITAEDFKGYFTEPVQYEMMDNRFYLTDEQDGVSGKDSDRLTSSADYQIDKVSFSVDAYKAAFNTTTQSFGTGARADWNEAEDEKIYNNNSNPNDILNFYAQFGSTKNDFVKVAEFDPRSRTFTITDDGQANGVIGEAGSGESGTVIFANRGADSTVVGYKVVTRNAYYYTRIGLVPSVSLKGSDRVLGIIKTAEEAGKSDDGETRSATESVALNNKISTKIYDYKRASGKDGKEGVKVDRGADGEYTHVVWGPSGPSDADYIRRAQKQSELTKDVVSSTNLTKKKQYRLTWKILADEKTLSGQNEVGYVQQPGGTFYDLLPLGSVFDPDSLIITTENGDLRASSYKVSQTDNYKDSGRTLLKITISDTAKWYEIYYDTVHSYESIRDYGTEAYNSVAFETNNSTIADGQPDQAVKSIEYTVNDTTTTIKLFDDYAYNKNNEKEKEQAEKKLQDELRYMSNLDADESGKTRVKENRFIYKGRDYDIAAITAAATGLTERIRSERSSHYDTTAVVDNNTAYSYRLRFQNSNASTAQHIRLYDILEDSRNADKRTSDWQGVLQSVDLSELPKDKDGKDVISPVVYYTTDANVSYPDSDGKLSELDFSTWNKLDASTGFSIPVADRTNGKRVTAVVIDLDKAADGKSDYTLGKLEAVAAYLNMKAPAGAARKGGTKGYPEAYNAVRVGYDRITDSSRSHRVAEQNNVTAQLVISRDINLLKESSQPDHQPIRDIQFRLTGTSDYGTSVDKTETTDTQGKLTFTKVEKVTKVEKGTYTLMEYGSNPDWLPDHTAYTVEINDKGELWITNPKAKDDSGKTITQTLEYAASAADNPKNLPVWFTVYNDPRVHGDLTFYKARKKTATDDSLHGISDTVFMLSGTSDYGNDVAKTATSDKNGLVKIKDIEKGTYTLREQTANPDYILNDEAYRVVVDEAGHVTLQQNKNAGKTDTDGKTAAAEWTDADTIDGTPVIYNTPMYWEITFVKVDKDLPVRTLQGAEFSLSGGSLTDTATAESDASGRVTFKHLKAGSYVLKETVAPSGLTGEGKKPKKGETGTLNYTADPSSYIVTVKDDGTFTIAKEGSSDNNDSSDGNFSGTGSSASGSTAGSGTAGSGSSETSKDGNTASGELKKNDNDDYIFPDERALDGQITIIRKWEDTDTNNRKPPVIRLSTTEDYNKVSGATVTVEWLNDYMKARPDSAMNKEDALKIVIVDEDGHVVAQSDKKIEPATSGNIWTYNFKDVELDSNTKYYVYEENLHVKDVTNQKSDNGGTVTKKYEGTADGQDKKIPLTSGRATIQNTYSEVYTFVYTGGGQSFTPSVNGYYKLEVWGASGGDGYGTANRPQNDNISSRAGYGGYSDGIIHLTDTKKPVYIFVGGQGMASGNLVTAVVNHKNKNGQWYAEPAYNGGGSGYSSYPFVSSGGGMTHMSFSQNPAVEGETWEPEGTILVAGGGGGADNPGGGARGNGHSDDGGGGDGGGIVGGNAYSDGWVNFNTGGGTSPTSGHNSYSVQGNGQPYTNVSSDCGGGGGGWYGGRTTNYNNGGAGGGSGYVDTQYLTNAETIPGSTDIPTTDGTGTEKGHFGNGYAKITFVNSDSPTSTPTNGKGSSISEGATGTDYVTDDENKWVKNGDTWEYKLNVFNDNAAYTVSEDPTIDGYTYTLNTETFKDDKGTERVDCSKHKTIMVTNTRSGEFGSLTVSKTVIHNGTVMSDSTQAFNFTLQLIGHEKSGTEEFGEIAFNDGVYTFQLKNGESRTFTGLPKGTQYKVTEDGNSNYIVKDASGNELSDRAQSGTIGAQEESKAAFTNVYNPPAGSRADVTLAKKTEGSTDGAEDDLYTFRALFNNLDANLQYSIEVLGADGKALSQSDLKDRAPELISTADGNGSATIKLKSGEKAVVKGLPVGATYQFIEEGGRWTSRYNITNAKADDGFLHGSIAQSSGETTQHNTELGTAQETVDENENPTVTFTNTLSYTQNITVKKVVLNADGSDQQDGSSSQNGSANDALSDQNGSTAQNTGADGSSKEKFSFTMTITGLKPGTVIDTDSIGRVTADSEGEVRKSFELSNGKNVQFKGVPVSAQYSLTEEKNSYIGSYVITDTAEGSAQPAAGSTTIAKGGNQYPQKELTTVAQTVQRGTNPFITVTNAPKSTSFTLKKVVEGKMGSKDKKFTFTLTMEALAGKSVKAQITYAAGKTTETTISFNSKGEAQCRLADGESIKLNGIQEGTVFTVSEDALKSIGYRKAYMVSNHRGNTRFKGAEAKGTVTTWNSTKHSDTDPETGTTVTFINTLDAKVPTGIHLGLSSSLMGVAIAAGALVVLRLVRRAH